MIKEDMVWAADAVTHLIPCPVVDHSHSKES